MSKEVWERINRGAFAICAALVVILIAAIFVFVGSRAHETFTLRHVNPLDFFTKDLWSPENGAYGALILVVGSLTATVFAVLISTPISVGLAMFVTEIAPPWARRFMQPVLELFTGIPSIIYGFLGLELLIPLIANVYNTAAGGFFYTGYGLIAAALVLAIMILPTITTIAVDALAALPVGLRESSLALGATRWQTIRKTLLPAASSGIFTGVVLGTGRAIGETLAVAYVIGSNAGQFPVTISNVYPYVIFHPTSTITVQILQDLQEITPGTPTYDATWTLAFLLLLISLLLVIASRWIASRSVYNARQTTKTPRTSATIPGQAEPRSVAG